MQLLTSLLLAGLTLAAPLEERQAMVTVTVTAANAAATPWDHGAVTSFPIHSSCNATLRAQLEKGLADTIKLASHAKEHLLRHGQSSPFVQKYFGNASTATPIGWFERIVSADRGTMLFRCDDPDRNCATQNNWAGHWRGSNATQETVICPRSFQVRLGLESLCNLGYTVANSPLNTYWGTDLLHRILHVPQISEEVVDHFTSNYTDVMALAAKNTEDSVIDSDTLQFFAVDVYAFDVAAPGVGCSGSVVSVAAAAAPTSGAASSMARSSTAAAYASSAVAQAASVRPSTTLQTAASLTSSAATECHTHSDGVVHCT